MSKFNYEKFKKRYNKFKKNNLPTPFWDEERQTFEYVYFYNGKSIINSEVAKDNLEVNPSLTDSLGEIALTGFYYPFTDKHITMRKINNKYQKEVEVGHNHAHSFEEVVEFLYDSPESFSISKDEVEFYSKQELEYLRRVQKYLLFIGMKDLVVNKRSNKRYQNKLQKKYENVMIYKFKNNVIEDILDGKRNFRVIEWYEGYEEEKYKPKEYQALLVDEEDNIKVFVEFTYDEAKTYKDIKRLYKNDLLKDEDKIIVKYFKILEKY